jgi:molecular chaperone DnaK (HSP70)
MSLRWQGGGTLDVSILHVSEGYCEVMGSDGDDRLGGADFDAAVSQFLTQQHSQMLQHLSDYRVDAEAFVSSCGRVSENLPLCSISSFHTIAERLKIALSQTGGTASASCLAVPPKLEQMDTSLETICSSLYLQELQMTLEEYNTVSQPLFDRSVVPVTRLLDDLSLQPHDIDEIVMVGGTTRMPQIRALVRDAFSAAQLNTHIDPDITVAYGAASVID